MKNLHCGGASWSISRPAGRVSSSRALRFCVALWVISRLACVTRAVTYTVCSLTRSLQNATSPHRTLQNRAVRCREFFLPPTFSHMLVFFFMLIFQGNKSVKFVRQVGRIYGKVRGNCLLTSALRSNGIFAKLF